jgi:hypothetical protein
LTAAFGWGISVFGIFMPWPSVVKQLNGLGANNIGNDSMLDYWLRMTAGVYTAVGIFFIMLAIKTEKYKSMLPFAGIFLVFEGIVLFIHGIRLGLEPIPFYVDSAFCLFTGIGIWFLRKIYG